MTLKCVAALILCFLSVIYDAKTGKIPNELIFPFMAAGIILNTLQDSLQGLGDSILGVFIPFFMLFLFFIMKTLGAGDIKLYMAVGSIVGYIPVINIIIYSTLSGGIIALCIMIIRKNGMESMKRFYIYLKQCFISSSFMPYNSVTEKQANSRFRYSYAIFAGTIITFFFS